MSYPRQIRTLVIEDEQTPIENYRALFEQLKQKFDIAPPVVARSYDDGVSNLSGSSIFHLVIVDLGLPRTTHGAADSTVEPGIDLVARCAARDDYPIPAVLVISGRLGQTNLPSLRESLSRDFWHGEMVNKGFEADDAIEKAIEKVISYSGVGIHIRDGGDVLFPTLTPREDDLLRRCISEEPYCIGADLAWWGTYHGASGAVANRSGITKVLWGRFLLSETYESSRPAFFKFEATESAKYSQNDIALMVQKLSHVKRCAAKKGTHRSLIITQQVGDSSARPISLAELLARSSQEVISKLSAIAEKIAAQVASLGSVTEDQFPISRLLWNWHDLEKIRAAYVRHAPQASTEPLILLEKLRSLQTLVWVKRRSCTHGDLNATNVAIEVAGDAYHAYIIDGAGMRADTAGRDFAMLEVTTLLHRSTDANANVAKLCYALYTIDSSDVPSPQDLPEWSDVERNTFELTREIRKQALQFTDLVNYAILVFDCAMMQLGGLVVQSRGNKIASPKDAVTVAEFTARWLALLGPNIVGASQ